MVAKTDTPQHLTTRNIKRKHRCCTPSVVATSFNGLYRTQNIALLVKYALISQFVKRDKKTAPLSLMLIAEKECNKTRILLTFESFPNTETIEILSAKPLNDLIREQDKRQTIHHLIILDFIRILQQKYTTTDAITGTILNLVDEGAKKSLFYGQEYSLKHRIQIGIITGITPPLFKKHFSRWNDNGIITRFLFCSYAYSEDTRQEIQRFIAEDLPTAVNIAIAKVKRRGIQNISINKEMASAIFLLTEDIRKKLLGFYIVKKIGKTQYKLHATMEGFRLHKQLRLLAKSIAYDRGDNRVNYEDLVKLKEIAEFIKFPNEPKEV